MSFQDRVLRAVLPVCSPYGLVIAGDAALRAHGCPHPTPSRDGATHWASWEGFDRGDDDPGVSLGSLLRRGDDLTLATAGELPPPGVFVAALDAADLDTVVVESTPRQARFLVGEPVTWQRCELSVLRESLRRPPVECGDLLVVGLDDAVGLKMRSLHDRGLAEDVMDVASVAHLYSYRELESLGQGHHEAFSVHELTTRLEFVDSMDVGAEVRRFAAAWVEDIKLRRAEEGDVDYDDPDLPHLD